MANDTRLHEAVRSGNRFRVEELVAAGADLRAVDDQGLTALHHAVSMSGDELEALGILAALLGPGAPLDVRSGEGLTPFEQAVFHNSGPGAELAFLARADPELRSLRHDYRLLFGARLQDVDVVTAALAAGADANARDAFGMTPLMGAVSKSEEQGALRVVEALLAGGADPRATDGRGTSVLSYAIDSEPVVRQLLAVGADPNAADTDGCTPLVEAARCNNVAAVRALLEGGADPRELAPPSGSASARRQSALTAAILTHYSAYESRAELPEIVCLLIAAGGASGSDLFTAASNGQPVLVRALLEAGVSPDDGGRATISPRQAAASRGHAEVVALLDERGARS